MAEMIVLALALAAWGWGAAGCDDPPGGDDPDAGDGGADGDADGDAGGDADGDEDSTSDGDVEGDSEIEPAFEIDPDRMFDDVAWLAADERAGRFTGTEENEEALGYVEELFADIGLVPYGDEGTYRQRFEFD